jgi:hypothetical protein
MTTVLLILPVFFIITSGWLCKKFRIVDEVWIHVLNGFAYYVSLPALIITSFWSIDFLHPGAIRLIIESALTSVGVTLILWAIIALLPLSAKLKSSILLVGVVGNTVYMGFPIIGSAFGDQLLSLGTLAATIYLIVPLLLAIGAIQWWMSPDHSFLSQLIAFVKNPLVISAVAGVLISFVQIQHPLLYTLRQALVMVGSTASPVALFALGAFLHNRFLKRRVGLVIGASLLKVVVVPLALFALGASGTFLSWAPLLVVLAAMPVAVTTFVVAQQFKLDETLVSNALLVSTVLSFVTIPLIISFL